MFLDLNNIDVDGLMRILTMSTKYKSVYTETYPNFYEFERKERLYGSSQTVIPNVLYYTDYAFQFQNICEITITDNIYNNVDDFIQQWIDDQDIDTVKFTVSSDLNHRNISELEDQLKLFYRFKDFCNMNKDIIGYIGCVFDFYKDEEDDILKIERQNNKFLKVIKIHNYSLIDLIYKFDKKEKAIQYNTSMQSYSRNLNVLKFQSQPIFKTFNIDFFKDHIGLQRLSFIENL